MGKITGFMEYRARRGGLRARRRARQALHANSSSRLNDDAGQGAGRALHGLRHLRSATAAARSTTSFRTATTWCTAATGRTRSTCCTRPTTSPSSPAASAPRRARRRARSTSTTIRSASSRSSTRSSTRPGTKAGSCRSRRQRKTGKKVAVVGSGPAGLACRAAAGARRPRRDGVREERPHRRPAALRHSRLQDGEVRTSTAASSRCRPKA